jgi:F-type H+-transporting ATPase subunit alpha
LNCFKICYWNVRRTNEKALLSTIAKEGKISDDTDAKLKKVVQDFLATFNA